MRKLIIIFLLGLCLFVSSCSITHPVIQISGGILHWQRQPPATTFILKAVHIEIYNFGDVPVEVDAIDLIIDGNSHIYEIKRTITAGNRIDVTFEPMLEGYDGGERIINMNLLSLDGQVLYTHPTTVTDRLDGEAR